MDRETAKRFVYRVQEDSSPESKYLEDLIRIALERHLPTGRDAIVWADDIMRLINSLWNQCTAAPAPHLEENRTRNLSMNTDETDQTHLGPSLAPTPPSDSLPGGSSLPAERLPSGLFPSNSSQNGYGNYSNSHTGSVSSGEQPEDIASVTIQESNRSFHFPELRNVEATNMMSSKIKRLRTEDDIESKFEPVCTCHI